MVNKLIRDCPLVLADLLMLSFHEFDTILGFDWLTRHIAMVDCQARGVRLIAAGGIEVALLGEQTELANKIIFAVSIKKMIV